MCFSRHMRFIIIIIIILNIICIITTTNSTTATSTAWQLAAVKRINTRLNTYRKTKQLLQNLSTVTSSSRYLKTLPKLKVNQLIVERSLIVSSQKSAQLLVKKSHLINKSSQSDFHSKQNLLKSVKRTINSLQNQIEQQSNSFIYKNLNTNSIPKHQAATTSKHKAIILRNLSFARLVQVSNQTHVSKVNSTNNNVAKILKNALNNSINSTSFPKLSDSQNRLYFEGTNTAIKSIFYDDLTAGCCGRLKPLETNRLMTKHSNQVVNSRVELREAQSVFIETLEASQIKHQFKFDLIINSPPYEHLIDIRSPAVIKKLRKSNSHRSNALKLIFANKQLLQIDNAHVSSNQIKQLLTLAGAAEFNKNLFIDERAYLVKKRFEAPDTTQFVASSPIQVNNAVILSAGGKQPKQAAQIFARSVNGITHFNSFVTNSLVRADRRQAVKLTSPIIFKSPVTETSQLLFGRLNSLQVPGDLILIKSSNTQAPIVIAGPLVFSAPLLIAGQVSVFGSVCSLTLPNGVISLHKNVLSDKFRLHAPPRVLFVDGIHLSGLQIGHSLDSISLFGAQTNAASLMTRELYFHGYQSPSSANLIAQPASKVHIEHVELLNANAAINKLSLDDVIELGHWQQRSVLDATTTTTILSGHKLFAAHVDVAECNIRNINNLQDWHLQLVRADQLYGEQTIEVKLDFGDDVYVKKSMQVQSGNFGPKSIGNIVAPELWRAADALRKLQTGRLPSLSVRQVNLISSNTSGSGNKKQLVNGLELSQVALLSDALTLRNELDEGKVKRSKSAPFKLSGRINFGQGSELIASERNVDAQRAQLGAALRNFDALRVRLQPAQSNKQQLRQQLQLQLGIAQLLLADANNEASFVNARSVNGVAQFAALVDNIMSLTREQVVRKPMIFSAQTTTTLEAGFEIDAPLNGWRAIRELLGNVSTATYIFSDGLKCSTLETRQVHPTQAQAAANESSVAQIISVDEPLPSNVGAANKEQQTQKRLVRLMPGLLDETLFSEGSFAFGAKLVEFEKLKVLGNVYVKQIKVVQTEP